MLVIRDAQWEVFEREAALDALLRATPGLRGAPLREARARAHAAFDAALARGLRGPDALARFAGLDALLPGFADQPWARAILAWDEPQERRLAALERRVALEVGG